MCVPQQYIVPSNTYIPNRTIISKSTIAINRKRNSVIDKTELKPAGTSRRDLDQGSTPRTVFKVPTMQSRLRKGQSLSTGVYSNSGRVGMKSTLRPKSASIANFESFYTSVKATQRSVIWGVKDNLRDRVYRNRTKMAHLIRRARSFGFSTQSTVGLRFTRASYSRSGLASGQSSSKNPFFNVSRLNSKVKIRSKLLGKEIIG